MTVTGKCYPYPRVITETRANLNLARKITWQHDTHEPRRQHEWQQFTTRSKSRAGSYLALVSSFTCMPQWTHRGWPDTIPYNIHKEVGYRPTQQHVKLLSLGIPCVPYAPVHFKWLFIRTQPTRALNDTGGGYHIRALNIRSDHSSSSPSSILHFPLIAPSDLQLYQSFDHLAKPHRTSIDRKGHIASGFQQLVFYWKPTPLSIAYYHYISFIGINKVV
jgi:hypothetical protein